MSILSPNSNEPNAKHFKKSFKRWEMLDGLLLFEMTLMVSKSQKQFFIASHIPKQQEYPRFLH